MVLAFRTAIDRSRSCVLAVLLLSIAACGAESPAAESAQTGSGQVSQSPASGKHTGFSAIDDYVLQVAGVRSESASLFASSETRAILILSQDLPAPVLLWPRSRRVETLQMLKVAQKTGGVVEILPDPVIAVHAPFRVETPNVKFVVDGLEAALVPKPPLIGLQDVDSMLDHSKVYGHRAEAYVPSTEGLASLRRSGRPARVRVFFGSWCPACGQMVPRIIKVAQQLGTDSPIEIEYYGLPQGFAGNPEAERYGIQSVPTAVVLSGDTEIGRISGDQWRSPEQTLVSLLGAS